MQLLLFVFSVLKSFIYDPLLEWGKANKTQSTQTNAGEIKNEKVLLQVAQKPIVKLSTC